MSNKSLISVLIPAYNHENYVQETIKSIINQTYQNIELLIIDDGSKDSTWQKIQELKEECEKRFTRFYAETKENQGSCVSLNKLIPMAKGDYIYIIASDDMAKPNAMEKEAEFLNNNPDYSFIVGDNEIIDNEGKVCYWDKKRRIVYDAKKAKAKTFVEYLKRHNNYFNDRDFGKYSTLFRENYIPNGYMVRSSIFNTIGLYPEGHFVDDYWLMLQVSKYSKMKYIDEILYSYRWHNTNTIKSGKNVNAAANNTLALEVEIQNKLDRSKMNQDVLKTIDEGVVYKRQGIPFLFEIISVKKGMKKIKKIKFFNISIYTYNKES